ncbi:MAG: hypothetical protein AAF961_03625, partial [Planctomycetota bacterium]
GLDGNCYELALGEEDYKRRFVAETALRGIAYGSDRSAVMVASGAVVSLALDDSDAPPTELLRFPAVATALAVSYQGDVLAGSGDGRLFSRGAADEPRRIAKFGHAVASVACLGGPSEYLLALSDGRLLRLCRAPDSAKWTAEANPPLTAAALLAARRLAVFGDDHGRLSAFDIGTGELAAVRDAHQDSVWAISSDRDQGILVSVGADQRLCCWELPELELKFETTIDWGVRDVCVAPDGSWIAAAPPIGATLGENEGVIAILDPDSGACRKRLEGHSNWVLKLAAAPNGALLASTGVNRMTRVWNLATGKTVVAIAPAKSSAADHLAFNHTGDQLFIGHRDGAVTGWGLADGRPIGAWSAFGDAVSGLAVVSGNRIAAVSRSDPRLQVRDFSAGKTVATFDLGLGYLSSLHISNDERYLAARDQNGRITTMRLLAESSPGAEAMKD